MIEHATDVTEILSGLSLFADLSRPQLEEVAHIFEEQWFSEGQRILRQGFTGSAFYLIVDGEATVRLDGQDIARVSRGEFFGEISILLGEAPTTDVVALGPLRCLVLSGTDLQSFLESHPKVMYRVLQQMAMKLRRSNQR